MTAVEELIEKIRAKASELYASRRFTCSELRKIADELEAISPKYDPMLDQDIEFLSDQLAERIGVGRREMLLRVVGRLRSIQGPRPPENLGLLKIDLIDFAKEVDATNEANRGKLDRLRRSLIAEAESVTEDDAANQHRLAKALVALREE